MLQESNTEKLTYAPLPIISKEEAIEIIKNDDFDMLKIVPLSLGEYCEDSKFSENICLTLMNHSDEVIRTFAMQGLAYIARNHCSLERARVEKPVLKMMRSKMGYEALCRANDAFVDIYLFMKWNVTPEYIWSIVLFKLNLLTCKRKAKLS